MTVVLSQAGSSSHNREIELSYSEDLLILMYKPVYYKHYVWLLYALHYSIIINKIIKVLSLIKHVSCPCFMT